MAFPAGTTPARKLLLPGLSAKAGSVAVAVGFDLDGASDFFSGLWQVAKVKAAEILAYLATLISALSDKVDELLPPETRSETLRQWLHVTLAVVLPVLVLLCVARCCCAHGGRSRSGRQMAAPGRGGARMPRGAFEVNPRGYFRDLRAGKPLVY